MQVGCGIFNVLIFVLADTALRRQHGATVDIFKIAIRLNSFNGDGSRLKGF